MTSTRNLCWGIWLVCLCGFVLPVTAKPKDTRLQFNVKDSIVAVETITESTVRSFAFPMRKMENTERLESEKHVKYEVTRVPEGFTISETLLSVRVQKDGNADDPEPFDQCLLNHTITYHADKNGKLQSIAGIEQVIAFGHSNLSATDQKELGNMLDLDTLTKSIRSTWDVEVDALLGRLVTPGDTWTTRGLTFLPDSKLGPYTQSTKMGEGLRVEGRQAVTLTYQAEIDKKAMSRGLTAMFNADANDEGAQLSWTVRDAGITGSRVVDAATLLDISGTETFTTRADAALPKNAGKLVVTIRSTSTSTLQFGASEDTGVWHATGNSRRVATRMRV